MCSVVRYNRVIECVLDIEHSMSAWLVVSV